MVNKKTLIDQKKSTTNIHIRKLKPSVKVTKVNPKKFLLNEKNLVNAILECLINNDVDGVMEVIGIYLKTLNKSKLLKEKNIPRSTVYSSLKAKNPTLKTLAKIISTNISSELSTKK